MRKWLNNYFDLSKREFNGLLTLVVLVALISVLPMFYGFIWPEDSDAVLERVALEKLAAVMPDHEQGSVAAFKENRSVRSSYKPARSFPFDPNTIGEREWVELGLSKKQAQAILKYRNKGGRFYKKEDLQKMYTISPSVYGRLAPYVNIDNGRVQDRVPDETGVEAEKRYSKESYTKRELLIVDLNTADTLMLDELKGIGPAFARRIVAYREKLGGFYRREQLLEVYGMDSARYDQIKDNLRVDVDALRKININTAIFEDFKNHPYLKYKQVNAILQYRKQHGNYNSVADLKKVAILSPEIVDKLAPYISF